LNCILKLFFVQIYILKTYFKIIYLKLKESKIKKICGYSSISVFGIKKLWIFLVHTRVIARQIMWQLF